MTLKYLVKAKLPRLFISTAWSSYKISEACYYYPQYILANGRAGNPRNITFEITFRCNLGCIMCPLAADFDDPNSQIVREWKSKAELSTDEIFGLVDDSAKMGVRRFMITGGEPFLREDLIEIIRYIKQRNMRCRVLSNGTLINDEMAEILVYSGLDFLVLSLDGPEEIHNSIRNYSKAFLRTVTAAKLLNDAKKQSGSAHPMLSFCCTISAANFKHLKSLIRLAKEVGADVIYGYLYYTTDQMIEQTNKLFKMGNVKGENQNVCENLKNIDPEVLYTEVLRIKDEARQMKLNVSFIPDLRKDEIYRRFMDDSYSYVNKCFYPWYEARINPYGVVYPCSMNVDMGDLREKPLTKIWNNHKYIGFRKALKENKLFPKCTKCCKLYNKIWDYLPKL